MITRAKLAEICKVPESEYQQRLHDADCNTEEWWTAALLFPIQAMQSPLFQLMLLAEPERWGELEVAQSHVFLGVVFNQLTPAQQEALAADMIDRMASLFPLEIGRCKILREIASARRAYAQGKYGVRKRLNLFAKHATASSPPLCRADMAIRHATHESPGLVLRYSPTVIFERSPEEEIYWQYQRARQYQRGEAHV